MPAVPGPPLHIRGEQVSWEINASMANYDSNVGQTANAGSYGANPWGFFDMHGNAYEWTADWYGAYEAGPLTDPTGAASGANRVLRGGSWNYSGSTCVQLIAASPPVTAATA